MFKNFLPLIVLVVVVNGKVIPFPKPVPTSEPVPKSDASLAEPKEMNNKHFEGEGEELVQEADNEVAEEEVAPPQENMPSTRTGDQKVQDPQIEGDDQLIRGNEMAPPNVKHYDPEIENGLVGDEAEKDMENGHGYEGESYRENDLENDQKFGQQKLGEEEVENRQEPENFGQAKGQKGDRSDAADVGRLEEGQVGRLEGQKYEQEYGQEEGHGEGQGEGRQQYDQEMVGKNEEAAEATPAEEVNGAEQPKFPLHPSDSVMSEEDKFDHIYPFLKLASKEAADEFHTLLRDQQLTKKDLDEKRKEWAQEQPEDVKNAFYEWKEHLETKKARRISDIELKLPSLADDTQQLYWEVKAVINDQKISRSQECHKIRSIVNGADVALRDDFIAHINLKLVKFCLNEEQDAVEEPAVPAAKAVEDVPKNDTDAVESNTDTGAGEPPLSDGTDDMEQNQPPPKEEVAPEEAVKPNGDEETAAPTHEADEKTPEGDEAVAGPEEVSQKKLEAEEIANEPEVSAGGKSEGKEAVADHEEVAGDRKPEEDEAPVEPEQVAEKKLEGDENAAEPEEAGRSKHEGDEAATEPEAAGDHKPAEDEATEASEANAEDGHQKPKEAEADESKQ